MNHDRMNLTTCPTEKRSSGAARERAVEEDVLDEIGEHADELYRSHLLSGRSPTKPGPPSKPRWTTCRR